MRDADNPACITRIGGGMCGCSRWPYDAYGPYYAALLHWTGYAYGYYGPWHYHHGFGRGRWHHHG